MFRSERSASEHESGRDVRSPLSSGRFGATVSVKRIGAATRLPRNEHWHGICEVLKLTGSTWNDPHVHPARGTEP